MKQTLYSAYSISRNFFALLSSYPLAIVSSVIMMILIFSGLYFTGIGIDGNIETDNIEGFIIKFVIWSSITVALSSISGFIEDGTSTGSIEIIWTRNCPTTFYLFLSSLSPMLLSIISSLVIAFILNVVFGDRYNLSIFQVASIFFAVSSAVGVGLLIGGLTIIFKAIGPVVNIAQFLLLPVIMNASRDYAVAELFVPGFAAVNFGILPTSNAVLFSLINCGVWLLIGTVAIKVAVRFSKRNGLVYQY